MIGTAQIYGLVGWVRLLPHGCYGGTNVSTLLEFKTAAGDSLLVEVEEPSGGPVTRGGRTAGAIVEAGASLEQVHARLRPAAGDDLAVARGGRVAR